MARQHGDAESCVLQGGLELVVRRPDLCKLLKLHPRLRYFQTALLTEAGALPLAPCCLAVLPRPLALEDRDFDGPVQGDAPDGDLLFRVADCVPALCRPVTRLEAHLSRTVG